MFKVNRKWWFCRISRRVACVALAAVLLFLMSTGATVASAESAEICIYGTNTRVQTDLLASTVTSISDVTPTDVTLPSVPGGISAQAALLMVAETGEIIFRQNENARLPMASTTKIMTALVALEHMPLDAVITITAASVGVEGSSIYLVEGEQLTLEDLLYALLLQSANDAAEAIAVAVAGSVEQFAALMNEKASELGLTDTHFVNPHGLDDEAHYTTAHELAKITRAALANADFRRICSTERKTIPLHNTDGVRLLLNHNKLLKAYEGCIGVKTGFTKRTGRCLVSAAERDGLTLIAVTLNDPNDWQDHTDLLDYGFSLYESVTLCEPGFYHAPLWVITGTQEYVMVDNTDFLTIPLRRDHGSIHCVVELPRFAYAPVVSRQAIGQLVFWEECADGTTRRLGAVPLYASYGVDAVVYRQSLWERLRSLFQS